MRTVLYKPISQICHRGIYDLCSIQHLLPSGILLSSTWANIWSHQQVSSSGECLERVCKLRVFFIGSRTPHFSTQKPMSDLYRTDTRNYWNYFSDWMLRWYYTSPTPQFNIRTNNRINSGVEPLPSLFYFFLCSDCIFVLNDWFCGNCNKMKKLWSFMRKICLYIVGDFCTLTCIMNNNHSQGGGNSVTINTF